MISKDDYIKWTIYCDCACVDIQDNGHFKDEKCARKNATVMNRLLQKIMALIIFQIAPKVWLELSLTLGANGVS